MKRWMMIRRKASERSPGRLTTTYNIWTHNARRGTFVTKGGTDNAPAGPPIGDDDVKTPGGAVWVWCSTNELIQGAVRHPRDKPKVNTFQLFKPKLAKNSRIT